MLRELQHLRPSTPSLDHSLSYFFSICSIAVGAGEISRGLVASIATRRSSTVASV
jgi:hypothetical protein